MYSSSSAFQPHTYTTAACSNTTGPLEDATGEAERGFTRLVKRRTCMTGKKTSTRKDKEKTG
jgi:hypothetical protein